MIVDLKRSKEVGHQDLRVYTLPRLATSVVCAPIGTVTRNSVYSIQYTARKRLIISVKITTLFAVYRVVCRVLSIRHTVNNLFAVCTHNKNITHGKVAVYFLWHTQSHALSWHIAKY